MLFIHLQSADKHGEEEKEEEEDNFALPHYALSHPQV